MKQTSQEIITRLEEYKEAMGDNFIGFVEDIADSVAEPDYSGYVSKEEYDALQEKLNASEQRYLDRFKGVGVETGAQLPAGPDTPKKEVFDIDEAIIQLSRR